MNYRLVKRSNANCLKGKLLMPQTCYFETKYWFFFLFFMYKGFGISIIKTFIRFLLFQLINIYIMIYFANCSKLKYIQNTNKYYQEEDIICYNRHFFKNELPKKIYSMRFASFFTSYK